MSYQVSHSASLSKRWPHWYSLFALAFHSWVIYRGVTIVQALAARGRDFESWLGDQKILVAASIIIILASIVSLIQRTTAKRIMIINILYSVGMIVFGGSHLSLYRHQEVRPDL